MYMLIQLLCSRILELLPLIPEITSKMKNLYCLLRDVRKLRLLKVSIIFVSMAKLLPLTSLQ